MKFYQSTSLRLHSLLCTDIKQIMFSSLTAVFLHVYLCVRIALPATLSHTHSQVDDKE